MCRLQDGLGAETAETSIATSPGNASAPRTQPRAAGSAGQQQQRVGHGHAADGTGGGMGGSRPGYMSANHLLNFQYDGTRSGAGGRVSLALLSIASWRDEASSCTSMLATLTAYH